MKRVKFSRELSEIISRAAILSTGQQLGQITASSLILSIVRTYRDSLSDSTRSVDCPIFLELINNLSITDRDNLCNELNDCFKEAAKVEIMGDPDKCEYTEELDKFIKKCIYILNASYQMKGDDPEEFSLDTSHIIIGFLTMEVSINEFKLTYEDSLTVLKKYGIDIEQYYKKSPTLCGRFGSKKRQSNSEEEDDVVEDFRRYLEKNAEDWFKKRLAESSKEDDYEKAKKSAKKEFEKFGMDGAVSGFKKKETNTPTLDTFAVNMNEKALNSNYDPVIGRDNEVMEIIRVLSCRLCNNPLLLGDPGCGKTAIVEFLAGLIAKKDKRVPEFLQDKVIYNLDVNAVVAGCMYRGQFEERLQTIITEVVNAKNVIVYIDEIHNMMGAGAGAKEGNGDMANILKPFLSRGEFQCIGSTTTAEYRKFIEKDKALVRRFGPIFIGEPGIQDTISIVKGVSKVYEKYHKVKYNDDALIACVELADRYIYDGFFPAKAIRILDKAGSEVKISRPADTSIIKTLENEIASLEKTKSDIILNDFDNFDKASELKDKIDELKLDLEKQKAKLEKDRLSWTTVTIDDVVKVISETSGVPVDKIKSTDLDKVRVMKSQIEKKVVGQEEAVEELSIALQQNLLGLRDPKKPIASFLFVGCTGVGKTLMAKTIAEEFFGGEKNLVTISCSEYMQDWSESKLLGSAPGYVGFDSTEPRLYILKRQPYTVLLIDEIEKSSSNLYNIWLNMLEEGEITLSSGEKVSCRNCIIIFTGNVGTKALELKGSGIGFGKLEGEEKKKFDVNTVMKEVNNEFRPEFLNRLTKIVVFNSLDKDKLGNIYDLELKKLHDLIKKERKLDIKATSKVKELVVSKVDPKYGARSLKRLINDYIQKEICKKMLEESVSDKTKVKLDVDADSKIVVEFS